MGSSDLTTDMALGILAPTSSASTIEKRSPNQDAEARIRRRRQESENAADELTSLEESENAHELDSMA
jgi:hypothetical protein